LVICRLGVEAAVDLFAWRAVKIPYLETEASRLDKGVGECGDADGVGFTLGGLDVVGAVCLDITERNEVPEVVCMSLHPGAGKKLRESGNVTEDRDA
jgi:hypothetical protein